MSDVPKEDQVTCEHKRKTFLYTNEDWFEGDEEDVYQCDHCGKRIVVYIPR